jgi:hypothetical protein
MKILILGLPKSGTTALYFSIKHAVDPDTGWYGKKYDIIYEQWWKPKKEDILCKFLIGFNERKRHGNKVPFEIFDKSVLIVRDPRDRLVSAMLYAPYNKLYKNEEKLKDFLKLLRKKEENPNSVSLKDLHENLTGDRVICTQATPLMGAESDIFDHNYFTNHVTITYEDYIDKKWDRIEDYLGFKLEPPTTEGWSSHVPRQMTYGGWKNWFTEEDVEDFKPIVEEFMLAFYPHANWDLPKDKVIDKAHSTEYVAKIINTARKYHKMPPLYNLI